MVIIRITKSLLEISTLRINLENLEKQGNVAVCAQEGFVFYPKFQENIHEYLLYFYYVFVCIFQMYLALPLMGRNKIEKGCFHPELSMLLCPVLMQKPKITNFIPDFFFLQ